MGKQSATMFASLHILSTIGATASYPFAEGAWTQESAQCLTSLLSSTKDRDFNHHLAGTSSMEIFARFLALSWHFGAAFVGCPVPKACIRSRCVLASAEDAPWCVELMRLPVASESDSPDMPAVLEMQRDVGGESALLQKLLQPSFRQYVICRDSSGEIQGCAQITRLVLGGYMVLSREFHLRNIFVRPGWEQSGMALALVQELLHRLPSTPDVTGKNFNGWAVAEEGDTDKMTLLQSCGGLACGKLCEIAREYPLVFSALTLQGTGLGMQVFRLPGLGSVKEYQSDGRLKRS